MSLVVERKREPAQHEPVELAAVAEALAAATDEERLADHCMGHVRAETYQRLGSLRDGLRATLEEGQRIGVADLARRLRLVADVDEQLQRIEAHEAAAHMEALVRIQEGIVRLRKCETIQDLIEAAPRELLRTCGFTRALLSRVRGSLWVPEVLEIVEGVDPEEAAFKQFVDEEEIPLAQMLMETELVRRRIPVLVSDPYRHPRTYKPIVEAARSTSYAAAPIMPTSRVIGFFHVDRFGQDLPVSPQDRDNLWVFSEHFGLLYERAILVERLESQRAYVHNALSQAVTAIDEICTAEISLARNERAPERASGRAAARPRSRLDTLLTAREQEVLELMASGATNNQIARELVVSEGTVKSHVKRILRKLRVENRAGAVARYLHLVRGEGG
jgi:DNA-binding CsgD family transcriptional regulator